MTEPWSALGVIASTYKETHLSSVITPKPEPAVKTGGAVAALAALLTLLIKFGVNLSADQVTAILGFVSIAGPLVAGYVIRGKVRPVETSVDIAGNGTGNTNLGAGYFRSNDF